MTYSPKLKTAMEQIKEILNKHDIAGFVVLHTPGHSEFLNHVKTSYSCAINEPNGVRFKLKVAEIGKDKASELANGTYNMVFHLANIIGMHAMFYMDSEEMLKKQWKAETLKGGGFTFNDEIYN